MDLLDSVRILLKRRWLTLPLLIVTLVGVIGAAVALPWTYRSEATVVFLSSQLQSKQTGGNPWLSFDSSLTVTAEVVGREMMDDRTVDELRARGNTATYKVGIASDSTGPVLVIEAQGAEPVVTQNTLDAVLRQIRTRLDAIQTQGGVASPARIRLNVVSASTKPQLMVKGKAQMLIMGLVLGLALTVGVPLLTESLATRRRRARPAPVHRRDQPLDQPSVRPTGSLAQHTVPESNGHHQPVSPVAKKDPVAKKEEWEPYLPPDPTERRRR